MTVIYLRKQSPYEADQGIKVTVRCEAYDHCKLFQRYKHELKPPTRGCIYVFKQRWSTTTYIALAPSCKYSCAKLKQVDVYFNKYENKTPLLFVLHFHNGDAGVRVENRYYPRSKFDTEMTGCTTKRIDELCQYTDDKSILCALIHENDALNDVLTYDIMQRPDNGVGTPCKYNCDKINVTEDTNGQDPKLGTGFTRYVHKPANGHGNKKACLVYNCNTLLGSDGNKELEEVQGKPYSCVTVYFGGKAKRGCTDKCKAPGAKACTQGTSAGAEQTCPAAPTTGDGTSQCQDVPLMIALDKGNSDGGNNNTDYYVHRRKASNGGAAADQYYWVKLTLPKDQENGNGELTELLKDIGMPVELPGGNGTNLGTVLGLPANGDGDPNGQTTYLDLLLKRLEFDLTDSVVILMDKTKDNCPGGYGDGEIQEAIKTLESGGKNGNINRLKLNNGTKIGVADAKNGQTKCLENHKYRVVQHDFGKAVGELGAKCSAGLRFLIHTRDNGDKYAQLRLYSSTKTEAQHLEYKYYQNGVTNGEPKVYVVFYGDNTGSGSQGDPRPLLLCYQGQTYKPKGKDEYFSTWVKVNGLQKCLCQNGGVGTSNGADETLLKAVTETVGFLNKVNLYNHPGPSSSAGGQAGTTSGVSGATCQADGTNGTNTCNYPVHTYNGSKIQVKVTCSQVNANGSSCYKKLTHTPAGLNGKGATNGFRLGDVAYCRNGTGGEPKGKIDYYGATSGPDSSTNGLTADSNKWAPLKSVTAYFYNDDTKYQDPLLVVLEFAKVTPANGTDRECYRLKTASGDRLEWEKDTTAKSLVGQPDNGKLVAHLDGIRYCLKKVVRIQLEFNGKNGTQYPLVGREANGTSKGDFTPINGGQTVSVTVQECSKCPVLTDSNYICVKHNLSKALEGKHDKVAGLAFTLPGQNGAEGTGDKVIEIPLEQSGSQDVPCQTGSKNGQAAKITYNQCMGDIYVYFYHPATSDVQPAETDTVPLMLRYNGQFYCPCDRDSYFDKWMCVTELCKKVGTCKCPCCCGTNADGRGAGCSADCDCCSTLVTQLNEVNLALNRIDLDPGKAKSGGYGLPESGGIQVDKKKFPTERVKVVTQKGPKQPPGTHVYERVVHRTKNGFHIGDIKYGGKDIKDGITPKGENGLTNGQDTKIPIANGGHKDQVRENQWNTVVVYYSKTDDNHKLPQLIVILKTDTEVSDPVTGSKGTNYGYYVLATKSGVGGGGTGSGYQYEWRLVNSTEKPATSVKLDDATDFSLLNSAVLLLELRLYHGGSCSYGEEQIGPAVTKAIQNESLKESPGNKGQVNRLKDKKITVTEEKGTHQCLNNNGFKVMAHCLDDLVNLGSGFEKLTEVKLIAGLRFLTPTNERGKYKQVKLKDNGATDDKGSIMYHQNGKNKVCIYFYDKDLRPLLVCYNGWAYRAKTMDDYDKQQWLKSTDVTKCGCAQTEPPAGTCDKCPLVTALVRVRDFLNPVDIKKVPDSKSKYSRFCDHYCVHKFNGRKIWIRVSSQPACGSFCFNRYTHTHAGITGKGDGFRLGNIHYGKECIQLVQNSGNSANGKCINSVIEKNGESSAKPCETASHVVVFYYKLDDKHQTPIVVAMCTGTCTDLKCELYYVLKDRTHKKYTKGSNGLTMDNPEQLAKELDKALFENSKHLRVVLAKRPVATRYLPNDVKNNGLSPEVEKQLKELRGAKKDMLTQMVDDAAKAAQTAKAAGTTHLKPPNPWQIHSSLTHHVLRETSYKAQLFEADGKQASTEPKETVITVREVDCSTIYSQGGYRCFQHLLTTATGIEQVGGLRLWVWVNEGAGAQAGQGEITLCTGYTAGKTASNCQNGKNGKIDQITYTVCKGDLYVFFYGEDPRPLMLCYDNCAYRPMSLETYCTKWVKVDGATTGSRCSDPKSRDPKVLTALYDVSQFMNPVRLCLGPDAIEAMKHKKPDQDGQGKQEKPGEYSYVTHRYPPQCIRVRVTAHDHNCYRRYTHQPEKQGFRLGAVTYAGADEGGAAVSPATCTAGRAGTPSPSGGTCSASSTPTPTTTPYCFAYDYTKQLLTVSTYYYMYDIGHKWPLVVELGFKGWPSEFYRLCSKPEGGSNGTPGSNGKNGNSGCSSSKLPSGGLKWVRMTEKPGSKIANSSCPDGSNTQGSTQNGQGDLCQPCNTGAGDSQTSQTDEDRKKMCAGDAEFAKEAERLQNEIDRSLGDVSVFLGDRVPLERDLNDLIERRALEIRTQLGIDYGEKTKERLILETASNCWEDSIVAYVVFRSQSKKTN